MHLCVCVCVCVCHRYAGDKDGLGGIYNFVTKRGLCHGDNSKISWTQVRVRVCVCVYVCPDSACWTC